MAFPSAPGQPSLLFTDVETGGRDPLDPRRGMLLEVGFRVTDADLTTIAERAWLIPYRAASLDAIRAQTPTTPVDVRAMHETSGLWRDLLNRTGSLSYHDAACSRLGHFHARAVAESITGWLHEHGADGLPLAGSSVGFDRAWLNHWLPGFTEIPHRRNVDVSSVKELVQRWAPAIAASLPAPAKRHRVLSDIEDTVRELAFYRSALHLDAREARP